MWQLLGRPKTQKVTRSLAKQFSEMEPAPHDRPLSERRLTVYESLIKRNQFRPVTWATAICKETDGLYRVNGKHTSTLLSTVEPLPEFYVTVEEYECETLDDVARLYATFDSNMQSRTAKDIYLSFASTVKEFAGIPTKIITTAPSSIYYAKFGESTHSRTQPADRAEMLLEYSEFVCWLADLVAKGTTHEGQRSKQRCSQLLRVPVVAAMFSSWSRAQKSSTEFWAAVRDDSGIAQNSPDRKLSRYLLVTGMRKMDRGGKLRISSDREIYVKCLHAWNAWRKGVTTDLKYYPDAKIPAVV